MNKSLSNIKRMEIYVAELPLSGGSVQMGRRPVLIVQNDVFIYDIIKQYNNVKLKHKNTAIDDCLSKLDKIDLNAITNSNHIKELLSNRQANLNSYENITKQIDVVKSAISNFKICPLCGNSVHL